jgi:hypothetical protein
MSFSGIPIRTNDSDIEAGWFNALRTAGLGLEGETGTGELRRNTSVVDLVTIDVDESIENPAFIEFEYAYVRDHDNDNTDVLRERGVIRVPYENPFTTISEREFTETQSLQSLGGAKGVTFSVTSNLVSTVRTIGLDVQVSDSGAISVKQGDIFARARKIFV